MGRSSAAALSRGAAGRRAAVEDNRRAIAEAHELGAACLVMVCGGLPPGSKDLPGARAMVRDGLHALIDEARAAAGDGRAAAGGAAVASVRDLVGRLRDHGLDAPGAQQFPVGT